MRIDIDTAKGKIHDYPYALLYMFDKVMLSETSELTEIDWKNCYEARFFGDNGELCFLRDGREFAASEYDGAGEVIVTDYLLDGRFNDRWKTVGIKQFVDYDEDGQVYVKRTVLSGLGGM